MNPSKKKFTLSERTAQVYDLKYLVMNNSNKRENKRNYTNINFSKFVLSQEYRISCSWKLLNINFSISSNNNYAIRLGFSCTILTDIKISAVFLALNFCDSFSLHLLRVERINLTFTWQKKFIIRSNKGLTCKKKTKQKKQVNFSHLCRDVKDCCLYKNAPGTKEINDNSFKNLFLKDYYKNIIFVALSKLLPSRQEKFVAEL